MQRKHVNMIRSHGHECHFVRGVIRGHSTVASNQSSPPGMQRAVGYKMHCSFVSPIPFNCGIRHVTVPLATRILIANVRHIGVSNICVINLVYFKMQV